jgi:Serine carboxypeptidase
MIGLFQEHGPCRIRNDSSGVDLNPMSWSNVSNMYVSFVYFSSCIDVAFRLYLDQPVDVGFSYGGRNTSSSLQACYVVWKVSPIFYTYWTFITRHIFSSYRYSFLIRVSVNMLIVKLQFGLNRMWSSVVTCLNSD